MAKPRSVALEPRKIRAAKGSRPKDRSGTLLQGGNRNAHVLKKKNKIKNTKKNMPHSGEGEDGGKENRERYSAQLLEQEK